MQEVLNKKLFNIVISGYKSVCYSLKEPLQLRICRALYERYYTNEEAYPLISVYIPTYNRAKILIERAVTSVLKQTYKNFELIIVGDKCTDETEELLSRVPDSRIKFYNLPKRGYRYPDNVENHWLAGPVVASNKAISLTSGKWIARIDDDDTWSEDHLEVLLAFAKKENLEFVSGQYLEERLGKTRIDDGSYAQDSYYTRSDKKPKGYNPKIGGTSTWLYRSYLKFFKYNIDCWRKSWNRVNDIDLSLRFFKAGVRMGYIPKVLAFVVPRPGENSVGMEAYKLDKARKQNQYTFSNKIKENI